MNVDSLFTAKHLDFCQKLPSPFTAEQAEALLAVLRKNEVVQRISFKGKTFTRMRVHTYTHACKYAHEAHLAH